MLLQTLDLLDLVYLRLVKQLEVLEEKRPDHLLEKSVFINLRVCFTFTLLISVCRFQLILLIVLTLILFHFTSFISTAVVCIILLAFLP